MKIDLIYPHKNNKNMYKHWRWGVRGSEEAWKPPLFLMKFYDKKWKFPIKRKKNFKMLLREKKNFFSWFINAGKLDELSFLNLFCAHRQQEAFFLFYCSYEFILSVSKRKVKEKKRDCEWNAKIFRWLISV